MAAPEHLEIIRSGVEAWNQWRHTHHTVRPDLSGADLRQANLRSANLNNTDLTAADLDGANLERAYLETSRLDGARLRGAHLFDVVLEKSHLAGADLTEAQLWRARLAGADLQGAKLRRADLRGADLNGIDGRDADFQGAELQGAQLFRADLRGADLRRTGLRGAQIWESRLAEARLAGAEMAVTSLADVDLSRALGLAEVRHRHGSSVAVDTLERTAFNLSIDPSRRTDVETFLRGAGVRDAYLEIFHAAIAASIGVTGLFLHASEADRAIVRRLHDALQERGVRCWMAEHPMLPGETIDERIDPSLRPTEVVLLCASEASLGSWWVESELDRVTHDEQDLSERLGRAIPRLRAIDLDGFLGSGKWESRRADDLRSRVAASFAGHADDPMLFERGVDKVLAVLEGHVGEND